MESSVYNGPSNEKWILSQGIAMSESCSNFYYNHHGIKFGINKKNVSEIPSNV